MSYSAKQNKDKVESVEEFLARTKSKITTIEKGASSIDDSLGSCKCGCYGNYTDHMMRRGEKGLH